MNGTTVVLGVVAVVSILMIGVAVLRKDSPPSSNTSQPIINSHHRKNSLGEDFNDILALIPLEDISRIIYSYVAFDRQVSDTVEFINDMKAYICNELKKLPYPEYFYHTLQRNGLQVKMWEQKILDFWKNMPVYVNDNPNGSCGGLSAMISSIQETVCKEDLHTLLCFKVRTSKSFRRFLRILTSQEFISLTQAIEKSPELQRLFYWAKEADIEVTFAVEYLIHLHTYLTVEVYQSASIR